MSTNNIRLGGALTERERQVLELMSQGKSNGQIGLALHLSEDTVKTHCRRLFIKLGADNRLDAVLNAMRAALLIVDGIPPVHGDQPTTLARIGMCHPHRDTSQSVRLCADDHDAALLSRAMFGPNPTDPTIALRRSRSALERLAGSAEANGRR